MLPLEELSRRNQLLHHAVSEGFKQRLGPFTAQVDFVHYTLDATPRRQGIHQHPHWELSWQCHHGMVYEMPCGDVALRAGRDELVCIPPECIHTRRSAEAGALILGYAVHFRCRGGDPEKALVRTVTQKRFRLHGAAAQRRRLERLLAAEAEPLHTEEVALCLREILLALFRHNFASLLGGGTEAKNHAPMLKRLENHIAEHLSSPIGVDDMAAFCRMSRRQLYRLFQARYGMPIQQYLLARRLHQAAADLLATDRPVKMIACDSGFANLSYFARQFRRQFTIAPVEFRRRHREASLKEVSRRAYP